MHADDANSGGHTIIHRGLIGGQIVEFPLDGNSVKDGMPEVYEKTLEDTPPPSRALTQAELNRLEEVKMKTEFFAARDRIQKHPDPKLRNAVDVLSRCREEPKLWPDLRAFLLAGGPAEEHPFRAF